MARAASWHVDDIVTLNVGGKKFTVRRTDLLADPRSKLADLFKPGALRPLPTDKAGNVYLDRDPKSFRHILAYLRMKKERLAPSLSLPSKPDDLAKLLCECEALNLAELKELALEMLQQYLRTEEQHFVTSYVQLTMRDFETWQLEKEQEAQIKKPRAPEHENGQPTAFEEWENM